MAPHPKFGSHVEAEVATPTKRLWEITASTSEVSGESRTGLSSRGARRLGRAERTLAWVFTTVGR